MGKIEGVQFKPGVSLVDILTLMDESSKNALEINNCVFDLIAESEEGKISAKNAFVLGAQEHSRGVGLG